MFVDELIIGSTLESQVYAFTSPSARIVSLSSQVYYDFEKLPYSILNASTKKELFTRLSFMNSMLGKVLFLPDNKNIRLEENKCVVIADKKKHCIEFGRCLVFDSRGLNTFTLSEAGPRDLEVIDLYSAGNILKSFDFAPITTSGSLVSEIYPANVGRVSGARYVMDFYTVSKIPESCIDDFNYSSTMAKLKLRRVLDKSGFKGRLSKVSPAGIKSFSKINLEHSFRDIREPPVDWGDYETITSQRSTLEEILSVHKRRKHKV